VKHDLKKIVNVNRLNQRSVRIAQEDTARRHPGPFCDHLSYDREFCGASATNTKIGPRCKRHRERGER
jgi:hypothetical protein